jgi:uncharacterized tellurite resistance protein B-like protein
VTVNLTDLERGEWEVLLALLAHLAEADEHIDPAEVLELHGIADELGVDDGMNQLMRARGAVRTREDLLAAAATVTRVEARELMRTLLFDLAQSDGERSGEERALLEDIAQVWASETPR